MRSEAERDRRRLREFLAERDAACPCCGVALGGLASDRCPKCRRRLVLDVREVG